MGEKEKHMASEGGVAVMPLMRKRFKQEGLKAKSDIRLGKKWMSPCREVIANAMGVKTFSSDSA